MARRSWNGRSRGICLVLAALLAALTFTVLHPARIAAQGRRTSCRRCSSYLPARYRAVTSCDCDCDGTSGGDDIEGQVADDGQPSDSTSPDLVSGSFGATAGSRSATPNVIGDFFGGGLLQAGASNTVSHAFHTTGFILSGSPGDPNAMLGFEANGGTPDDFTTIGVGRDASGDGFADTFAMSEPLPPNEVPTSPGPGYTYDGGTVVYTINNGSTTPQDGAFSSGEQWFAQYSYTQTRQLVIPNGGGAAVRRIKIAENNSPIPRDRIIFNYHFFNDVMGDIGDVRRYTLGIEKTFFDGMMSIDVRAPYASTLNSTQTVGALAPAHGEFGNLSVVWKALLIETERLLVSGGAGVAIPTANDVRVQMANGGDVLRLDNEAVHVQPYFAALWTPNDNWFVQSFVEVDVATNGNPIAADIRGGALPDVGRLNDSALLFVDVAAGYWLYRQRGCGFTGIAPVAELHYATTTQDADVVAANGLTISSITNRFDVLNLTLGLHTIIRDRLTITPAMSIPLRRDDDRQFDFEAVVQANLYF